MEMYKLERTRKFQVLWGVLAFLFLVLSLWGFWNGGDEMLQSGFFNVPLPCIVMVVAFFSFLISLGVFFTLRAIQKDIEEQLSCVRQ